MIAISVLRKAMREIAKQKGEFTLFALLRRADAPFGSWDLVVSARWLESGNLKALEEFVNLIANSIGRKSLVQLARVEAIPDNDRTVKFILANFPVDDEEDGERHIADIDLFGLQMDEGIILRAKRPVKASGKTLHPVGAGSSRCGN